MRKSMPIPFRSANKSSPKNQEDGSPQTKQELYPSKNDKGIYRKLRTKMNQSITDMQGMFGGITNRENPKVLEYTMTEDDYERPSETPVKRNRFRGARSFASTTCKNKKK